MCIRDSCQAAGLKYGYHNHAHEFQKVEDKELMLDYMPVSYTHLDVYKRQLFTVLVLPGMGWLMGKVGKKLKRKSLEAQDRKSVV